MNEMWFETIHFLNPLFDYESKINEYKKKEKLTEEGEESDSDDESDQVPQFQPSTDLTYSRQRELQLFDARERRIPSEYETDVE